MNQQQDTNPKPTTSRGRLVATALGLLMVVSGLSGCAVLAVADLAASAAVGAAGLAVDAAVGTVKIGGKIIGAGADAALGSDEDDD